MRGAMAIRDLGRAVVLLLARAAIAALFLYTGWKNIGDLDATAARVAAQGYPAPQVTALVAALAQLLGGISVGLGVLFPLGVLSLVLFLAFATWSFHVPGFRAGDFLQGVQTFKNLSILAALLVLLTTGPGPWSFDRIVLKRGKG